MKFSFVTVRLIPVALLVCYSCQPRDGGKVADRPNVVVIMADDLGYSDIGCYGGEIQTPNLDRLAQNGSRLRQFYNAGRCCPTRASLLSGQYPHAAGMGKMVSFEDTEITPGPYQGFLREEMPTLAELVRPAGYKTYMAGKWHVGERPEHWPMKRGFDKYFGLISGASSYYEIVEEKRKRVMLLDDQPWTPTGDDFYMTTAFTDRALDFLSGHYSDPATSGDPFLLYLAYTAPHWPLHAPEDRIKKYEALYLQGWDALREARFEKMKTLGLVDDRFVLSKRAHDVPAWDSVDNKPQWARKMAVYAAMVDIMDEEIGRVIARLESLGQLDNTLILFLSDNGGCAENIEGRKLHDPSTMVGERGSYVAYDKHWANASNTPYKKYKSYMHEGGIISPLIVHWPARVKAAGVMAEGVGHVIDIFPTVADVCGVPMPEGADFPGQSLLPLLDGTKDGDRVFCWEHFGNKAIRKGNWKLVRDREDPAWALYDLENDPAEHRDVSAQHPDRVSELEQAYLAWASEQGV